MTTQDVEKFVIEEGNPEVIILHPEDWQQIYETYRSTNRDEQGVFVLVVNSRLYSSVPQEKAIDLSAVPIWPVVEVSK